MKNSVVASLIVRSASTKPAWLSEVTRALSEGRQSLTLLKFSVEKNQDPGYPTEDTYSLEWATFSSRGWLGLSGNSLTPAMSFGQGKLDKPSSSKTSNILLLHNCLKKHKLDVSFYPLAANRIGILVSNHITMVGDEVKPPNLD